MSQDQTITWYSPSERLPQDGEFGILYFWPKYVDESRRDQPCLGEFRKAIDWSPEIEVDMFYSECCSEYVPIENVVSWCWFHTVI